MSITADLVEHYINLSISNGKISSLYSRRIDSR
jgi:hypothetical protein